MSEENVKNDAPSHYLLVGMGRDAATRVLRKQNRGRARGRQVRIGPFIIRPNRAIQVTPEQVEQYATLIRTECEIGRLQLRDGDHNPVDLDLVLGLVEPMPDLSDASMEELASMLNDAGGDPALLKHVKAALIERAVSNIKAETNLEGLLDFSNTLNEDHPLNFGEVELALADRIKELREEEAMSEVDEAKVDEANTDAEEETSSDSADTEAPPSEEEAADTTLDAPEGDETDEAGNEDEEPPPYAEWEYSDLKAEVKRREIETDSLKKDDLIAALELSDEG